METILLVGFPNSGKSTLFNLLAGGKRKVTNYSGITVDSAVGELKSNAEYDRKIQVVDLPGVYGLVPSSLDEAVTTEYILGLGGAAPYNLVALILDMERLESSLSLCLALRDLIGDRLVLVVNKDDHKSFDEEAISRLEKEMELKVVSFSSVNGNGREIDRFLRDNTKNEKVKPISKISLSKESLQFFVDQTGSYFELTSSENELESLLCRYHKKAREIIAGVIKPSQERAKLTQKIDKFLIHPLWGSMVFVAIFYMIFHSIYTWSGPLMDLIDGQIGNFGEYVAATLPEGYLNSLLTDGIIAGVGGVVIFLPQIMILFFLLSVLEQSGYIARAAVLTDKIMGFFGLNGKAFLPYMSGFACSIPAIMAARTIPNAKERMATIMTIPMVTCAARLPVYVLLIGTFVPDKIVFGFFNARALSFFFLYFLGSFAALAMALIFRLTLFKGKTSSFFMDLPFYQKPSLKIAIKNAWTKGLSFLKKAGTVILALSIVIWFASTFPRPNASIIEGKTEDQVASISLQTSLLGTFGRTIEPVLKPIGMDWKMGVGILVAFGARELFVSTMGTIYALGDVDEESETLRQRLSTEKDPVTGELVFNLAVAWSILIFFVFSLQCTSTLAILKKETGGWKVPLFMFSYMAIFAYVGSFIVYHLLS